MLSARLPRFTRVCARLLAPALLGGLLLATQAPVAAAATCPSSGGVSIPKAAAPAGDLVVQGHGWGHSLGMSQYGAQGAARLGCNHEQILRTYYSGAVVSSLAMQSTVMVTLLRNGTSATVEAQTGDVVWRAVDARRDFRQPRESTWLVERKPTGTFLMDDSTPRKQIAYVATNGQLLALQNGVVSRVRTSGGTVVADRRVRWDHTRFVTDANGLQGSQVMRDDSRGPGVQKYLWGLAEVPVSWPKEALRTQAVAARTYLARRWDATQQAYVIGATAAAQHWTGYAQEAVDAAHGGHWKLAVDGTVSRVVTSSTGGLLDTLYSSSHGGRSEDARYVFGNDVAYLRSVDDSRWDQASDNPYRSWAVGFTKAQLASRFGMDTVTDIRLGAPGTTARLSGASVTGTRNGVAVTRQYEGWDLREALGVRSPGMASFTWQVPAGAVPLSGDWDGDGRDDVGWYSAGRFTLRLGNGSVRSFSFGRSTDVPVVGDWNGDGRVGIGVFRDGHWYLRQDATGGAAQVSFRYGRAGDRPVAGRWPGAATYGVGVVRGNQWYLNRTVSSGTADVVVGYGRSTDVPVVGDWDDDGFDTPGVVRDRIWYLANRISRTADVTVGFGAATDLPVPGDWDGNGQTTTGIARGATFYWRDDLSAGPGTGTVTFAP